MTVASASEFNDFSFSDVGKIKLEIYSNVQKSSIKSGDFNTLKLFERYIDGAIDGILTTLGEKCKAGITSDDIRPMLFQMNNDGYGNKFDLRSAIFAATVIKCDIQLDEKLKLRPPPSGNQ